MVAIGNKKTQKEDINQIKKNREEYFKLIKNIPKPA